MDDIEALKVAQLIREAEWKAYDHVLHWINAQDTKMLSKGDLYDAVIALRPAYFASGQTPVTAEELHALLGDEDHPVNFDAYVGSLSGDGILVVDGHVNLKVLATWINERMGATEGNR